MPTSSPSPASENFPRGRRLSYPFWRKSFRRKGRRFQRQAMREESFSFLSKKEKLGIFLLFLVVEEGSDVSSFLERKSFTAPSTRRRVMFFFFLSKGAVFLSLGGKKGPYFSFFFRRTGPFRGSPFFPPPSRRTNPIFLFGGPAGSFLHDAGSPPSRSPITLWCRAFLLD